MGKKNYEQIKKLTQELVDAFAKNKNPELVFVNGKHIHHGLIGVMMLATGLAIDKKAKRKNKDLKDLADSFLAAGEILMLDDIGDINDWFVGSKKD